MAYSKKVSIDLGIARQNSAGRTESAILDLYTRKDVSGRPQLVSTASVNWVDGMWQTHAVYKDMYLVVGRTPAKRVTQNVVDKEFTSVFTPEIVEHYTKIAKNQTN